MDISEAINLTLYPKEQMPTIMMFFMKNYSEREHSKLYLTNRDNGKIFVGRHNIPVSYSNTIYYVDILIYYPKNFLFSGPEFYFENKPNLGISQEYADVSVDMNDLKINIEFFIPWNENTKNLEEIINFLKITFDDTFPCYNHTNSKKIFSGLCNFSVSEAINVTLDNKKNQVKTNFYGVPMTNPNSNNYNNNNNSYYNYNKNNSNNSNNYNNNNNNNNSYYNNNNQNYNNNLFNNNVGKNPSLYNNNNDNFRVNNQKNYDSKKISSFNEDNLKEIIKREILTKIRNDKILETQLNDMTTSKNEITGLTNNLINSKEDNLKYVNILTNNFSKLEELCIKYVSLESSLNDEINKLKIKNSIPISLNNIDEYISNYNKNKLKYISYELTLNEYIASFKKLVEKGLINFQDAILKIRRLSREIFTIKVMAFKANNN